MLEKTLLGLVFLALGLKALFHPHRGGELSPVQLLELS